MTSEGLLLPRSKVEDEPENGTDATGEVDTDRTSGIDELSRKELGQVIAGIVIELKPPSDINPSQSLSQLGPEIFLD